MLQTIIKVLQNVLVWIKIAQGTVQTIPVGGPWKDDFMRLSGLIVNEITIFLETHQTPTDPGGGPARGFGQTVKFCDSVIARMDLVVASEAPKAEKLAQAKAIAAELSDPSKVYQAKKGDDAAALVGGKAAAERRIALIEASS